LTLREPPPLDLADDFRGQLGFRQQIIGIGQVEVGKYVSRTRREFSIRHLPSSLPREPACQVQPLPDQIKAAGYLAAAIYLASAIVLLGLIVQKAATMRLISLLFRPFPDRLGTMVMRILQSFVDGLGVFRSARMLSAATAISFLIWAGYALSLYIVFLAFNIELTLGHAFVVLLILTIVLTLPSSPGFVGVMETAIVFGLGLFGVDPDQAFAVAIVYHVTQYLPVTIGGVIALWLARLSVDEIAHVQGPPPGANPEDDRGDKGPQSDSIAHRPGTPREPARALSSDPL
jgi:hypothetical protein